MTHVLCYNGKPVAASEELADAEWVAVGKTLRAKLSMRASISPDTPMEWTGSGKLFETEDFTHWHWTGWEVREVPDAA